MTAFLTIGKFGAPHGVRGWIKVQSYTDPPDNILHYPQWFIQEQDQWKPLPKTGIRPQGVDFIAKIAEYDTPEQARNLTHHAIGIPSSSLAPLAEGEYYWAQLVGLQVFNKDKVFLGTIDHLFATGSNDVIVVTSPDPLKPKEYYIPYLSTVIVSIDCEQGCMIVDWDPLF